MLETRMNHNLFDNEIPINGDELQQFPFYTTEPTVTENIVNARISRHGFEHSNLWLELEKYRKENEHLRGLVQKTAQNAINAL